MKIKDMPNSSKPREKAITFGLTNLSDAELLAIIIGTGYKNKSALDLANEILNDVDSFDNVFDLTPLGLAHIKGVGISKSLAILAGIELGKRCSILKNNNLLFNCSENIYKFFKGYFHNKMQEEFIVILLDNKKRLIGYKTIFKGILNSVNIHPREVFKYAIINSSASIIVIHNHPSGDIVPSLEDINVTNCLSRVGYLVQIPLVDHLIIGQNNYYSFYEEGKLINEKN